MEEWKKGWRNDENLRGWCADTVTCTSASNIYASLCVVAGVWRGSSSSEENPTQVLGHGLRRVQLQGK